MRVIRAPCTIIEGLRVFVYRGMTSRGCLLRISPESRLLSRKIGAVSVIAATVWKTPGLRTTQDQDQSQDYTKKGIRTCVIRTYGPEIMNRYYTFVVLLRFSHCFLEFPAKNKEKSSPWSNFTGFFLYRWGVRVTAEISLVFLPDV